MRDKPESQPCLRFEGGGWTRERRGDRSLNSLREEARDWPSGEQGAAWAPGDLPGGRNLRALGREDLVTLQDSLGTAVTVGMA